MRLTRWLAAASLLAALGVTLAPQTATAGSGLGIHHVWVIEIENEGFDSTYVSNPNPYLSKTLPHQGALLTQYYGIGHVSLDNYIAEISGQAPNAVTQGDCQDYVDFRPGVATSDGQYVGQGCVYPPQVQTLANQLMSAGLTWKGYMQDMGNDENREPDRCGSPTNPSGLGFRDGTQSASAVDQYAARHNPFVYFHSIIDTRACNLDVVPLDQLSGDLASAGTTPNFSFITPNLCNDGHDAPCTGKDVRGSNAGGLVSVDHFLSTYVPLITSSAAFKQDGLIIIVTDEAANSDASSCCNEQTGPNTIAPGISGSGGGLVGAVVFGRCVNAGTRSTAPYNHYSLLRTLEDIYGIKTHLGYAGGAGQRSFGADVFTACPTAAPGGPAPNQATRGSTIPRTGGLPLAIGALLAVALAASMRRLVKR